jgi:CRISPR-associated protein Cas1
VSVAGPATLRLADLALVIQRDGEIAAKIPVEDLAVLVLDGPDILVSHQLLAHCADLGVAVSTADSKHMPNGLLVPLAGNSLHSATLREQIDSSVPAQKRTWQAIVRTKIRAQADVLMAIGRDDGSMRRLIPLVRSGDPENVEATAAAHYFARLFGAEFIRDRGQSGVNAQLNYGYAIVRSTVARAIVGAGLHPALGIHHHNQYNGFCLADDAMEPLRPMVDRVVLQMLARRTPIDEVTPATKREMITVLGGRIVLGGLQFPLLVGLERYAASLRRAICEGAEVSVPLPLAEAIYRPATLDGRSEPSDHEGP